MIKFVATILDRVLFTLGFVAGVQLPEFIQQYTQRLAGHLDEATYQLKQYQTIADSQFAGDLTQMIIAFQRSTEQAVAQTGDIVLALNLRVATFGEQLSQLQQSHYLEKIWIFATDMNTDMAKATANDFVLAIPIELHALLTGIVVAFVLVGVKDVCSYGCKKCYQRFSPTTRRQVI